MNGDSYIVRIYRRNPDGDGRRSYDRIRLVGQLETVENGQSHSFHTLEELWTLLSLAKEHSTVSECESNEDKEW